MIWHLLDASALKCTETGVGKHVSQPEIGINPSWLVLDPRQVREPPEYACHTLEITLGQVISGPGYDIMRVVIPCSYLNLLRNKGILSSEVKIYA